MFMYFAWVCIFVTVTWIPFLSFKVAYHSGYVELVGGLAEESMSRTVAEVQALPDYTTKNRYV